MQHFLCLFLVATATVRASVVPVQEPVAKAPVVPVVAAVDPVPLANAPVAAVPVDTKSDVPVVPYAAPAAAAPAPVPVAAQAAPVPVAASAVPAVIPEVPKVAAAPVVPVVEVAAKAPVVEEAHAEKNAQDASGVLNEPIDKATKLVIDLDEHLKKYLPAEDEIVAAPTSAPQSYAGSDIGEAEADRQNQMTTLIDQVNRLAESIENTITDLVARRRYVTAAMLRSMLNYVRRVRVNLERLQNRLQSVQAVATSGQNAPPSATAIPGASFFNPIRDRINRLTEEIGALVTRIRSTFTPGAATASPLPPLATASPNEVSAAAASASIASAVGTMNASGQQGAAVATSVATSA